MSDNETYNSLRFLNINDKNSDSEDNVEIDNI